MPKLLSLHKSLRGFTLIELMVAISIVAILSTIGIVSFSKTQEVARDSRRKSDLRSIAIALELYRQKNGYYPKTDWVYSNSASIPWLTGLGSNYISQIPTDPKQVSSTSTCSPWYDDTCFRYAYYSNNTGGLQPGQDFILVSRLENANDSQSGKTIQYGTDTFPDLTNPQTKANGLFSLSD